MHKRDLFVVPQHNLNPITDVVEMIAEVYSDVGRRIRMARARRKQRVNGKWIEVLG